MAAEKFYLCTHCGNLVGMVHSSGVPIICCGEPMKALVPNTVDAAGEKHLPVVSREGDKVIVAVGSVAHPMVEEHLIQWVYLETSRGGLPGPLFLAQCSAQCSARRSARHAQRAAAGCAGTNKIERRAGDWF